MEKDFLKRKKTVNNLDSLFIYIGVGHPMLGARLGHVFCYDWSYYKKSSSRNFTSYLEGKCERKLFWFIEGYEFTGALQG